MEYMMDSEIDLLDGTTENSLDEKQEIGSSQDPDGGIGVKIVESNEYFVVEAAIPGLTAEEILVYLTSRIITISTRFFEDDVRKTNKYEGKKGRGERNVSLYLDSSIDPGFSIAHYSRGQLYMKMLKSPGASVHVPVSLPVSG
jgi:HSP20 family molecular chaperone IbpA